MVAPTFGADRVLVTTASTGNGSLVLGTAVPGFHDPALAGLVSGRRYTFATLDSVGTGGAASNWDRGVGVLTESGGVWTLARTLVRRNKAGGTSPVNWPAGQKFVILGISADDVAMLDTVGWLGLGGDPTRERTAPLDVVTDPASTNGIVVRSATGTNGALENIMAVQNGGTSFYKPAASALPATDPTHLMRKNEYDAIWDGRVKFDNAIWSGQYDLLPNTTTDFVGFTIPTGSRKIFCSGSYRTQNTAATAATAVVTIDLRQPDKAVNTKGDVIADYGIWGVAASYASSYETGAWSIAINAASTPPGAVLRIMAYKDQAVGPFYMYNVIASCFSLY